MPRSQFEKVCKALHRIASQLSRLALQNVQQARSLTAQKRAYQELHPGVEVVGRSAEGKITP